MNKLLVRFWFNTEEGHGLGVTAFSHSDATQQIRKNDLALSLKPDVNSFVENIDIQKLDRNHVIPNMGVCTNRGIWFPNVG